MTFYNVPFAPGVPALSRDPNIAIQQLVVLTQDLIAGFLDFGAPQWGIYQNGFPVVVADSVISVEYRQAWNLSDYPIEGGGFESYNKVATPYVARVRFASGGGIDDRQLLFSTLAEIAGDLNLYDIVTAETVYTNANVEMYDYRRTATNGLGLLAIDVTVTEIRIQSFLDFQNTQFPSGASPQSGGAVQTTDPTTTQAGTGFF